MDAVIIVAPSSYDAELRRRLDTVGRITRAANGTLVLSGAASRVYVTRDDSLRRDFSSEDLTFLSASVTDPAFYSVDFSDISQCRRILEAIADDARVFVDNDHGVLVPGPEFVRSLRARRDWDWRRGSP